MSDGKFVTPEMVVEEVKNLLVRNPASYIVDSAEVFKEVNASDGNVSNYVLYIKTKYGEVEVRTDGRLIYINDCGVNFVRYLTGDDVNNALNDIFNECEKTFV